MFEYYCETCKRLCNFNEEIELREDFNEDWVEYHIVCDSKVIFRLKLEDQ